MFFYTIISDLKDVNNEFGINILRNFAMKIRIAESDEVYS